MNPEVYLVFYTVLLHLVLDFCKIKNYIYIYTKYIFVLCIYLISRSGKHQMIFLFLCHYVLAHKILELKDGLPTYYISLTIKLILKESFESCSEGSAVWKFQKQQKTMFKERNWTFPFSHTALYSLCCTSLRNLTKGYRNTSNISKQV